MANGPPQLNHNDAERQLFIGDVNNSIVDEYLANAGGATGMNIAADAFFITPTDSQTMYVIDSLKIIVGDGKSLIDTGFGSGAALTTGFKLEIIDSDANIVRPVFEEVTTNLDMTALGDERTIFWDESYSVTIKWGAPIRIPYGSQLVLTTQDAMAFLTFFKARAKGRIYRYFDAT